MRILMLGWEFPPFITGGLGTACYGLTKALDRRGVEVLFVLPKAVEGDQASHVRFLTPDRLAAARSAASSVVQSTTPPQPGAHGSAPLASRAAADRAAEFEHLKFLEAPIVASSAYASVEEGETERVDDGRPAADKPEPRDSRRQIGEMTTPAKVIHDVLPEAGDRPIAAAAGPAPTSADYSGDLMGQVHAYAQFSVLAAAHEQFDVIHAHDWLTYAAGLAVARITGRPLVVHVHSTEFDRSGVNVNQRVYDIERRGMHGAFRIVAVSRLTKNVIVNHYGIHPDKVEVVYNGVDIAPTQADNIGIESTDKIVLYFGRITLQKGPEYFIRAAKRVLEHLDDVKFVVAGSGDQAARMIEMAAQLGIGHKVLFTGFLRGKDIDRVFALANVYVMPSVSEPFGIAPLEAMGHDVPVIISKSSGVSEVLTHALKVDFWDVDDMANKIIAVLKYPPLSRTLREHGSFEVRRLTWDGAAQRCEQVYQQVMRQMSG